MWQEIEKKWLIAGLAVVIGLSFWGGNRYAQWQMVRNQVQVVEAVTEQQPETEEVIAKQMIVVHVTGAVEKSGVYQVNEGARVEDVLLLAQLSADAVVDRLNRAAVLTDGQKIVVPGTNDPAVPAPVAALESIGDSSGLININQADVQQLMKLPGIGEVKAQAIVDYRKVHGSFKGIEDLKKITGIGDKTYDGLKAEITI